MRYRDRTCLRCRAQGTDNADDIDDEKHIIFSCTTSDGWRNSDQFKSLFQGMSSGNLRRFMDNDDFCLLCKYIYLCLDAVDNWNYDTVVGHHDGVATPEQPSTG